MKDLFLVEPLEERALFSVAVEASPPGPPSLDVQVGQMTLFFGLGDTATAKFFLDVDNAAVTTVRGTIGSDVPG